jgi:hypothetical protein
LSGQQRVALIERRNTARKSRQLRQRIEALRNCSAGAPGCCPCRCRCVPWLIRPSSLKPPARLRLEPLLRRRLRGAPLASSPLPLSSRIMSRRSLSLAS